MPSEIQTDVVICGSGSAGLAAAVWLAHSRIPFRMLERRSGPLTEGQADGVQCRTVEIYESFGIAEELLREAYHVTELVFWSVDDPKSGVGKLVRKNRAADTPVGLSHQPHLILNQARMNGLLLEKLREWAPEQEVEYGHEVTAVAAETESAENEYPIQVTAIHEGQEKVYKAKYVLACDGAHSSVRRALGITMDGDSTDVVWGVMDIFPRTDFPDIRRKCTIQTDRGALLIIPREGGRMVRFYLQMPVGTDAKEVTREQLHERAAAILKGFRFEVAETRWWSAYVIGQRLASRFVAGEGRVFLTGDACHTHSPKAGQGMNVSLQDGHNIGWKLSQVLSHRAPASILSTYVPERRVVAADLIAFDRRLTELFHASAHDHRAAKDYTEHFLKSAAYMAGLGYSYADNVLTVSGAEEKNGHGNGGAAREIGVGKRLQSREVLRWCDAKVVQLQSVLVADNRWRIIVFCGDLQTAQCVQRLDELSTYLASPAAPPRQHTPAHLDADAYIELLLVVAGHRTKLEIEHIPDVFMPVTGEHKMRDLSKIYVDDMSYAGTHGHAYDGCGIDSQRGAVVVVRPDQHVSLVTNLEETAQVTLTKFFAGVLLPANAEGEDA